MMKKVLLNLSYISVTLLSLVIIYVFFIFNPNDYKSQITNYISSKTKYNFTYDGDIEISYYPDFQVLMPGIKIFKMSSDSKDMMIEVSSINLSLSLEQLMNKVIDRGDIKAYDFKYHGVNADDVLIKTYSLLKFSLFSGSNENITNVKNISAKFTMINNKMKISDIYMETEMMEARGNGSIDLITKESEFSFIGKMKAYKDVMSLYQNNYPIELINEELPIIISGELDNLSVSVNLNHIIIKKVEPIREKIIDEIQDKVINELRDKIKLPF